jgi:hypothetical protein
VANTPGFGDDPSRVPAIIIGTSLLFGGPAISSGYAAAETTIYSLSARCLLSPVCAGIIFGVGNQAAKNVASTSECPPQTRGLLPAPITQLHHIFPQAQRFRNYFTARGINIDLYTVELEMQTHLSGVHGRGGFVGPGNVTLPGRWNARWEDFISANPQATAREVYQFAGQLMDEFGLSGQPIVPYR